MLMFFFTLFCIFFTANLWLDRDLAVGAVVCRRLAHFGVTWAWRNDCSEIISILNLQLHVLLKRLTVAS